MTGKIRRRRTCAALREIRQWVNRAVIGGAGRGGYESLSLLEAPIAAAKPGIEFHIVRFLLFLIGGFVPRRGERPRRTFWKNILR